ncbi:hypothetical protein HPP92_028995, partial [Vanilla planifolia]
LVFSCLISGWFLLWPFSCSSELSLGFVKLSESRLLLKTERCHKTSNQTTASGSSNSKG